MATFNGDPSADLAIVGGGPAGMSAALVAGRARLRTIVINAEAPRNATSRASHGFLTQDGTHALKLLAIAREQLARYETVSYLTDSVVGGERVDGGFALELEGGERLAARRVVIATGQREDLTSLGLPGLEEVYGTSVFPCPFCDGWEHADQALAVFGDAGIAHFVPIVSAWSEDIVVFTNGSALEPETAAELNARGIPVFTEKVTALVNHDGELEAVELDGGRRVEREAGFIAEDCASPRTPLAAALGIAVVRGELELPVLEADEAYRSPVDRVYVVGDARGAFIGVAGAVQEGSECAESIVVEIARERWSGRSAAPRRPEHH